MLAGQQLDSLVILKLHAADGAPVYNNKVLAYA